MHGSNAVRLLQIEQYVMFSFTERIASHSPSTSARGVFRMWYAKRCALFAPMPGRRWNGAVHSAWGSVLDKTSRPPVLPEPWNLHSAHHALHLARQRFVDFAMRVVDRRHHEILQHLDVVFRHGFRIDLDRAHRLVAVHGDRDHAAAG